MICFDKALSEAVSQDQAQWFTLERGEPQKHRLSILWFNPKTQKREDKGVVPDAVLRIGKPNGETSLFFIEVDRGTLPASRWPESKVLVYREYRQEKKVELRERFGADSYMVLVIVPNERRLLTLAERTVSAGSFQMFCFTPREHLVPNTIFGEVWVRAGGLYERRNQVTQRIQSNTERLKILDF